MRRPVLITLSALLVAGGLLLTTQIQHHTGYFSPVFSPDGQDVYVIVRETSGLVTGFGWEFFSPPAHVFVWRDRFTLQRIAFNGGAQDTLATLPPSPLEKRRLRTYRGRAFTAPSTLLRWNAETALEMRIRLSIPVQPSSELHFVDTSWDENTGQLTGQPTWTHDWVAVSEGDGSPLSDQWELIAARGSEAFNCGIVGHHAGTQEVRVLIANDACADIYPDGLSVEDVIDRSRREGLERLQDMNDAQERLTAEAVASGMTAHDAALHVIDQMRELGYYARPPQLVARRLDDAEVDRLRAAEQLDPMFVIEEMQFTVGLFQDLERALDAPETPVNKSIGQYVIHRDYSTSQALNAFLAGDGSTFYVERGPERFEVRITNR